MHTTCDSALSCYLMLIKTLYSFIYRKGLGLLDPVPSNSSRTVSKTRLRESESDCRSPPDYFKTRA